MVKSFFTLANLLLANAVLVVKAVYYGPRFFLFSWHFGAKIIQKRLCW